MEASTGHMVELSRVDHQRSGEKYQSEGLHGDLQGSVLGPVSFSDSFCFVGNGRCIITPVLLPLNPPFFSRWTLQQILWKKLEKTLTIN